MYFERGWILIVYRLNIFFECSFKVMLHFSSAKTCFEINVYIFKWERVKISRRLNLHRGSFLHESIKKETEKIYIQKKLVIN